MFSKHTGSRYVLTRCADDQFSIATASPRDAQALAVQIRESGRWLEVVPGIDSVVVRFDALAISPSDASAALQAALDSGIKPLIASDALVEIPVVYGGECGPDPSQTCLDTGCPTGELCLPSDTASCVPSACNCDGGEWLCTTDCGQPMSCQPDTSACEGPSPARTCTEWRAAAASFAR